jgi:diguanylate cyclase (GGDEF)-like protein
VSSEAIELTLSQSQDSRRAHALLSLSDQLLFLIGQYTPETSSRKAAAIRQRVDAWRAALQRETDPYELAGLARQIIQDCETLLTRLRAEAADREAEFADLVQALQAAVQTIKGDAGRFDADMQQSAATMERISNIDDVRELRKALTREVEVLRETLARRRDAEARTTSRLEQQVRTLEENLGKARAEAATDALTGLPNRGGFDLALRDWLSRAADKSEGFTLAMVDLDDFKRINDTHGHQVGDRVLIAATQVLSDVTEHGELVCRYGGDEFAVLLKSTTVVKARARLNGALDRVAPSYEYQVNGAKRFVTFSFSGGITEFANGDTPDSILRRADEALLEAKKKGKRRIEVRTRGFLRAIVG